MLSILIKDTDIPGVLNEIFIEGATDPKKTKEASLDDLYKKARDSWLSILEKVETDENC